MRPVILKVRGGFIEAFRSNPEQFNPRFAITMDESKQPETGRSFSVPIFLRTRDKLSTFSSTVKSGLSGQTAVASPHRDDLDALNDWEMAYRRDKVSDMSPSTMRTHPWSLSTFDRIGSPRSQSNANMMSVDKPLPPVPMESEVSSMSSEWSGDRENFR